MNRDKAFVIGKGEELKVLLFAPLAYLKPEHFAHFAQILALTSPGHQVSFYLYSDEYLAPHTEQLVQHFGGSLRPLTACSKEFHLVFCFGGDAFLMKLGQFLRYHADVPVISLVQAQRGFFSEFVLDDLPRIIAHVEALLAGRGSELGYFLVPLRRLDCALARGAIGESRYGALGEVYVRCMDHHPRTFNVSIDGRPLLRVSCEGLTLSTALGAAERNCALGGPLLDVGSELWVLNAVAPSNCIFRPVVFGRQHALRVELDEQAAGSVLVVFDTIETDTLGPGEALEVRGGKAAVELVALDLRHSWAERLRRFVKG